jgi:hypothetical protein
MRTAVGITLALGFAAIVAAVACSGGTSVHGFPSADDAGCYYSCAQPCRGNGLCVPWPYTPSCLAPCDNSDECTNGPCLVLTTDGLPPSGSGVCGGSGLKICGADRACPPLAAMCRNATTLMKPLTVAKNLCGYELVNCPNGCDTTLNRCS